MSDSNVVRVMRTAPRSNLNDGRRHHKKSPQGRPDKRGRAVIGRHRMLSPRSRVRLTRLSVDRLCSQDGKQTTLRTGDATTESLVSNTPRNSTIEMRCAIRCPHKVVRQNDAILSSATDAQREAHSRTIFSVFVRRPTHLFSTNGRRKSVLVTSL